MARILTILQDGFEDAEAIVTIDMLRRAKQTVKMISVQHKSEVIGKYDSVIRADANLSDVRVEDFDALFIPGGPAVKGMLHNKTLRKIIRQFSMEDKVIAAICAAPALLGQADCLKGKKATCFPGFETYLTEAKYTKKKVEIAGNIITARGVGVVFEFALAFIERLTDKETKQKIIKETQM